MVRNNSAPVEPGDWKKKANVNIRRSSHARVSVTRASKRPPGQQGDRTDQSTTPSIKPCIKPGNCASLPTPTPTPRPSTWPLSTQLTETTMIALHRDRLSAPSSNPGVACYLARRIFAKSSLLHQLFLFFLGCPPGFSFLPLALLSCC